MDPISAEHRTYVEAKAPAFVRAVVTLKAILDRHRARRWKDPHRPDPTVHADLDEFDGDAFLLYACLWFARTEGVAVTFQPDGKE